jgi:hypothetical protein
MGELAFMMLEALMMVRKGLALTAPMLMMVMVSRGLARMLMREQIIYETTFNIPDRENINTRH